tara:strand:- start:72 stop:311 length:240 start_codon:yes stop_codon:yes gene_type:complete
MMRLTDQWPTAEQVARKTAVSLTVVKDKQYFNERVSREDFVKAYRTHTMTEMQPAGYSPSEAEIQHGLMIMRQIAEGDN